MGGLYRLDASIKPLYTKGLSILGFWLSLGVLESNPATDTARPCIRFSCDSILRRE